MDTGMLETQQNQQMQKELASRSQWDCGGQPWRPIPSQLHVIIKSSIYLVLFCTGLKPPRHNLPKSGYENHLRSGATIRHLLYMDDIKLYARTERYINSLIHLTRIDSKDM